MAGLGETCTHTSALLFYVETAVRIRDARTITQEAAYWKLPSSAQDQGVAYSPICQIDFTSAKSKKRRLDSSVNNDDSRASEMQRTPRVVPQPSPDDLDSFFTELSRVGSRAAVLSVVPGHTDPFRPLPSQEKYPVDLRDLYDPDSIQLSFEDLVEKCKQLQLEVTFDQANCVEAATRMQAASRLWYKFRSGRITASRMKQSCRTNPDQPSQSLVKAICYPADCKFTTKATQWGCSHEDTARKGYVEKMTEYHENFHLQACGFIINPEFPHIGASPDGKVSCDCCGVGFVEIKCPYCARDSSLSDFVTNSGKKCCLKEDHGQLSLKEDHQYMYQVQTQLHVGGVDYVDFVVWTNEDMHMERIESNPDLWSEICKKSKQLFEKAVLPELVSKFFSRPPVSTSAPTTNHICTTEPAASVSPLDTTEAPSTHHNQSGYCYCRQPEEVDDMIACDNKECPIVWFHLGCLKIDIADIPDGNWFCPDCKEGNCL